MLYQIGALDAFARAAGSRVTYVKPHGALYNTAAVDVEQAAAIVDGLRRYDPALALLCLPDSEMQRQAEKAGVVAYAEAFADRAYTADGKLVSRKEPGAVLHDAVGGGGARGGDGHRRRGRDGGRRASSTCARTPCACTGTRRARSTSPGGSAMA